MADDAIVYRYIAPHVIASLVVPMSMVGIYQWDGWMSDILKWRKG